MPQRKSIARPSLFREQMEFRTMNIFAYVGLTLAFYVVCVTLSIFVTNLKIITELLSAVAFSSLSFIWPGMFYIIAERRYGDPFTKNNRRIHRIHAWAEIVLGIIVMAVMLINNIMKIIEE